MRSILRCREPKLKIHTPILSCPIQCRSNGSTWWSSAIYEKNAFDFLDEYDQIAIIDADIYIRPDTPNIFDDFGTEHTYGAVCEREMPIANWYKQKIKNYSRKMQYGQLQSNRTDFTP